jgi:hypothetical protein
LLGEDLAHDTGVGNVISDFSTSDENIQKLEIRSGHALENDYVKQSNLMNKSSPDQVGLPPTIEKTETCKGSNPETMSSVEWKVGINWEVYYPDEARQELKNEVSKKFGRRALDLYMFRRVHQLVFLYLAVDLWIYRRLKYVDKDRYIQFYMKRYFHTDEIDGGHYGYILTKKELIMLCLGVLKGKEPAMKTEEDMFALGTEYYRMAEFRNLGYCLLLIKGKEVHWGNRRVIGAVRYPWEKRLTRIDCTDPFQHWTGYSCSRIVDLSCEASVNEDETIGS